MHGECAAQSLLCDGFLRLFGEERVAFESQREPIRTDMKEHRVFQHRCQCGTFVADDVEHGAKLPQVLVARGFSGRCRAGGNGRNVCGQTTCRWSSNVWFGTLWIVLRRLRCDGWNGKRGRSRSSAKRCDRTTFGSHATRGRRSTAATSWRRCTSTWRRTRIAASTAALKEASFEGRDAIEQFVDGQEWRASSESHERHFERGTRLSTPNDVIE